jgi:hypothetical protein
MSNKLENWIKARFEDEKEVMNVLQEYGVISDNCIRADQVGNDMEAMKWMACNHNLMKDNGNAKSAD